MFALPDGETGPRGAWVGYEREQLTRHATASRYIEDFGVAMYCGFGRQPNGGEGLRRHHG